MTILSHARAAAGHARARHARCAGERGSSLLFPFEDLTLAASAAGDATARADQGDDGGVVTAGHETTGFWSNSMIGNGSSNGGASAW